MKRSRSDLRFLFAFGLESGASAEALFDIFVCILADPDEDVSTAWLMIQGAVAQ
jgi:hypothetical protein